MNVEIRTYDTAWAARHGRPGRDGRTVVTATEIDRRRVTTTGTHVVVFTFGTLGQAEIDPPADYPPIAFAPVDWIVD